MAVSFDEQLSRSADDIGHLPRRPAHLLVVEWQGVQRTGGGLEMRCGEVHVNQGFFEIFMPEQDLNRSQINAGLIEMGSKTVTKRVGMNTFLEAGALRGFPTRVPNGFRVDGPILTIVAGKQPSAGLAVVATPVATECREELGAEHDIAILVTFAAADVHDHTLTIDVADFQVRQLRAAGAGGVESHEQDALVRSARCMEQLCDFFPAKNRWESTRFFRIGSVGKAPGSAERLDVEKAQRRQVLPYGIRRQLALLEQLGLIFANVSRT